MLLHDLLLFLTGRQRLALWHHNAILHIIGQ